MLVTRDGEVAYATLVRGSRRPHVDRAVVRAAEALRFRPAALDGIPVDVWVEQPVHLLLPVERSPRQP